MAQSSSALPLEAWLRVFIKKCMPKVLRRKALPWIWNCGVSKPKATTTCPHLPPQEQGLALHTQQQRPLVGTW